MTTRIDKLNRLIADAEGAAARLREVGGQYAEGYARGVEVMAQGIDAILTDGERVDV